MIFSTCVMKLPQFSCYPSQLENQNNSRLHHQIEITKALLKNVTNTFLMLQDVKKVSFAPFP